MEIEYEDQGAWIAYGVLMGWATEFNYATQMVPMTHEEDQELWADVPTINVPCLRVWPSK